MATSAHFKDYELQCKGRNCCGRVNLCKPELLAALESLRSLIGKPITVLSGYRCELHNQRIGGAKSSQHIQGIAADILVHGMTAWELEQAVSKVPAFKGIGRDDHGNDIHVDVRKSPAKWCYAPSGKTISYYAPKESSVS